MLRKLLRLATSMGTARTSEIAHSLGVSPALAEQLLEDLTRKGYLESVVEGCSVPCERCPLQAACLFRNQARLWVLTRKGEQLLARTTQISGG